MWNKQERKRKFTDQEFKKKKKNTIDKAGLRLECLQPICLLPLHSVSFGQSYSYIDIFLYIFNVCQCRT